MEPEPGPSRWAWDCPVARRRLEELYFPRRACPEETRSFWAFFERLRRFQSRRPEREAAWDDDDDDDEDRPPSRRLGLPRRYHPRHRVNLAVPKPEPSPSRPWVPREALQEFLDALLLYLDFEQKRSFAKLAKLQRERQALPIARARRQLLQAVAGNQVVVVAGDTGCGKSTQVPQFLLAAGYRRVACTQPRRIACVSLAKRVAFESLQQYGDQVSWEAPSGMVYERKEKGKGKKKKVKEWFWHGGALRRRRAALQC